MATISNLKKQTHVLHYLSFSGPIYTNTLTNDSVILNAKSNMFVALYLNNYMFCSVKTTSKLNKICDSGKESKCKQN